MKIFSSKISLPSARLLAEKLSVLRGERIIATRKPERIGNSDFIRYGNVTCSGNDLGLNPYSFTKMCANKKQLADFLIGENFFAPKFYSSISDSILVQTNYPVIVRETLTGFKGRGIHVCLNSEEFRSRFHPGNFWTPFIKLSFELRLHVLGGEVKKIFKKISTEDSSDEEFPIRNLDNGYHFSIVDISKYPKVHELFSKIGESIDLSRTFFAADIGWDASKKEYFILEFNSAPGLNELTAEEYAEFISRQI